MRDARSAMYAMNARITRELGGRLVDEAGAGSVAADLVRKLRAEDPGLLVAFLQLHAVEAVAAHIARRHPAPARKGPGPESIAARKAKRAQSADAAA